MAALQKFLRDELHRRDWSIEEFASRAGISTSNGYLIVRDGKDNVRTDTFEGIALALSMTPADLMIATGKGTVSDDDPLRMPLHAIVRQVAIEDLNTAYRVMRGFIAPSVDAKERRVNDAKAPGASRKRRLQDGSETGSSSANNLLRPAGHRLSMLLVGS
jgi:DNA-binding Xre family transcriptional regulator